MWLSMLDDATGKPLEPQTVPAPVLATPAAPTLIGNAAALASANGIASPLQGVSRTPTMVVADYPSVSPSVSLTPRFPLRGLAIGGGVGLLGLVAVILFIHFHSGSSAASTDHAGASAQTVQPQPTPTPLAQQTVAPPLPPASIAAAPASAPAPTVTPPPPPAPVVARPSPPPEPTLGGQKVVLEYDHGPTATTAAPTQAGNTEAVSTARAEYLDGNQKLFAGDTRGAIAAFKAALANYPGYVAGYRGLGLAYDQAGDTADALKALQTYVSTVPDARDVPILKKRIQSLQRAQ
jgi:hypothetical protein